MNKVCLIGNLTKDPEPSTIPTGVKVCKFTIAVNRNYSGTDGNRQTDFIPIVCWRNQAESVAKFLRKGSKVGITGSILTRSYDAPDGTKRYITEINADEVQFLSARSTEEIIDEVQDLPEVKEKKSSKIEDLKPIEDEDGLPF